MLEIIDPTGKDSDKSQQVATDVGRSMIRGRSETKSEANDANSTPAHNFGRQSLEANASPALQAVPVQSAQHNSPYREDPLQTALI
jgi:hypothetical protein